MDSTPSESPCPHPPRTSGSETKEDQDRDQNPRKELMMSSLWSFLLQSLPGRREGAVVLDRTVSLPGRREGDTVLERCLIRKGGDPSFLHNPAEAQKICLSIIFYKAQCGDLGFFLLMTPACLHTLSPASLAYFYLPQTSPGPLLPAYLLCATYSSDSHLIAFSAACILVSGILLPFGF